MTISARHRKAIPIGVKLRSCLLLLGFTDEEIDGGLEWDHYPALALRVVDEETGELIPHVNDPRHIRPLRKADHDEKTFGRGGERRICSAGSDIGAAAKIKRIDRAKVERMSRLMARAEMGTSPTKSHPKSKWPSRPFPKKPKAQKPKSKTKPRKGANAA